MSIAFVDPRADGVFPCARAAARTTNNQEALSELYRLCRDGRLYDVERWIKEGRPLQAGRGKEVVRRRVKSALEVALEAGNHALALLLLCNGYAPNLEPDCPLNLALRARRWDFVDLLLEWGCHPQRVNLGDLFDSYSSELMERFRALGVDLTANHEMAEALAYHTSNKPLFGFAKRHREHDPGIQMELNIALLHHAGEGNEKGVQLCLWAGADPHAPAASLRFPSWVDDKSDGDDGERFLGFTAIEEACRKGDTRILERLRPDPLRDNFEELYRTAGSGAVVRLLARLALPLDVGAVIGSQVSWLISPWGHTPSLDILQSLFEAGVRWRTSSAEKTADIRRGLLRTSDHMFVDAIKLFATDDYCSPEILQDLGRTSAMRARMKKVGFFPSPHDESRGSHPSRPTRSREILARFGVKLPKPKPRLPYCVEIGALRGHGGEIRLDRATMFDHVWTTPIEKLAQEWGLSDRGLAKACSGLKIPVPPRGFWAKASHGQRPRRPRLPELRPGEAELIIIRVPE